MTAGRQEAITTIAETTTTAPTNENGGRVRGTMSGDGSGNRRDRAIETESGDIVVPGRTRTLTPDSAFPGGNNPGGGNPPGANPGGSAGGGGGYRGLSRDGRDRRYRVAIVAVGGIVMEIGAAIVIIAATSVIRCRPTTKPSRTVRTSYPDYDRDDSLGCVRTWIQRRALHRRKRRPAWTDI